MLSARDGLSELVFEGLNEHAALQLSKGLLGRDVVLPKSTEGVCEHEISRLELGDKVALKNAHLRVLRYDHDVYDVEINFVVAEVRSESPDSLLEALHEFSIRLGRALGVTSFYAGLEPASDEETRYFTGPVRGPYM